MGPTIHQTSQSAVWALARRQHGVVARRQLLERGFNDDSIKHRIAKGRLHPVWPGVYAIGRPQVTVHGRWMAAVLSCGTEAVLSRASAGALWAVCSRPGDRIEVSVPAYMTRQRPGIVVHRRQTLAPTDVTHCHAIPVTNPICTLVDLAARLGRGELETAINEADRLDLIGPEELRSALDELTGRPGVKVLRETLDRRTFTLTDSELERRFLPVARRAGLSTPRTRCIVNGFRVDFYWPELRLVVETDGLRYHRTPAQQARDRLRDQAHVAAGLTPLRFTRAQVVFDQGYVQANLAAVARRLQLESRQRK